LAAVIKKKADKYIVKDEENSPIAYNTTPTKIDFKNIQDINDND
jgi:hypothetical protein